MAELKTALDERAFDRLILGTDAAVAAYQEKRLRFQTAPKLCDRADLAHTQSGGEDEIV